MKKSFVKVSAICLCLCLSMLSGCATAGRNNKSTNPNNTPQGSNMIGGQTQGTTPNSNYSNLSGKGSNPDLTSSHSQGLIPNQGNNINNVPPGQTAPQLQTNFDKKRADNIRRQLVSIPGVKQANVIVYGNTAAVGYNPTDASKDTAVLRNTIASKVKQVDSTIKDVAVSSSADMMTRMNQLGTDITNNKPAQELKNSYDKIISNIKSLGR